MTEREAIHKLIMFRRILERGVFPVGYKFDAEPFDMAISALEKQEKDIWIPVTERLPEEPDEVLVTDGDGEIRHAVYCHVCKKDVFITYEESMIIHEVIAWRPLPEPYTEEEA